MPSSASGTLLATSTSWTAGNDAIARLVTFNVTAEATTVVTIKLTPTNIQGAGNVSMVAVAVVGNKVASPINITANTTVTDIEGQSFNLTDLSNEYSTIYWEHYHNANKKANSKDIVYNNVEQITNAFFDYKANINWSDGSTDASATNNTNGLCWGNFTYNINVAVDENVKEIWIFTGSWKAKGTATVYDANGTLLATSDSWTADTNGIARLVKVSINTTETTYVKIVLTPSEIVENGNVNMVAVGVLGE